MNSFTKYFVNIYKNNYANFSGRARRKEFWIFTLINMGLIMFFNLLPIVLLSSIGMTTIGGYLFFVPFILMLISFVPSLGVTVRRLHDTGKTGWYLLYIFIPFIGFIILLVFFCHDSMLGPNKYGLNPKELPSFTSADHLVSD